MSEQVRVMVENDAAWVELNRHLGHRLLALSTPAKAWVICDICSKTVLTIAAPAPWGDGENEDYGKVR